MAWFIALASGAFGCLVLSGLAVDAPFRAHMGVTAFVLAIGAVLVARLTEKPAAAIEAEQSGYFDAPIRIGSILTLFWGCVGFLVGVIIALQLAFPDLNFGPWFNFGRMRPLHT